MKRNDILTIPNLLTGIRILLIPFFLYCYLNRQEATAALVIIICGITDFLDGFIARRFHMVSELGKKLDPIADKLLQLALLLALLFRVDHMIWLFLLFLVKEASMLICWLRLTRKGGYLNGALWFGKVSTAVFYVAMAAMLLLPIQNTIWSTLLMLVTGAALAMSFLMYMATYFRMFQEHK